MLPFRVLQSSYLIVTALFACVGSGFNQPVFSQHIEESSHKIEVVVKGKVFASLKDYVREKERRESLSFKRYGPWAFNPIKDVPEDLLLDGKPFLRAGRTHEEVGLAGRERGLDENGWKTVWLDGKHPKDSSIQISTEDKTGSRSEDNVPTVGVSGGIAVDDTLPVQRILGVSPSMTALVQDFEKVGVVVPYIGSQLIKVRSQDELGAKLREMAAGSEGPFIVMSSHNRIRLMHLKANNLPDGVADK